MTKDEFILECKKLDVEIEEEILLKLERYRNILEEWNKKFNLTNIIKEKDVYLKHYYDSLCLVRANNLKKIKKICDFGTGAGFPGLVLAIVFSNIHVTLLESNKKKTTFLKEVVNELELKNVEIVDKRVEEYAKKNREVFDLVTCRAVSSLGIILELSASLVKINGLFIPFKSNVEDELIKIKDYYNLFGYSFIEKIEYILPKENSKRTLLVYNKTKKTNNMYPRNYNIILKANK